MEPTILKSALATKNNSNEFYIGKLFQSRDVIHLAHLKTTSFAAHKAMNEYYDGILGHVDDITEALQGQESKLLNISIPASQAEDPITHLTGIKAMLLTWREDTNIEWLKNQIDECSTLVASTLYKLKFLK